MNITAVTATGMRPEAFLLCQLWMSRQTLQPVQWLVLDDGDETKCIMGQEHIKFPDPSLTRKLAWLATPGVVKGDAIVLAEDDDWYSPRWLEFCSARLGHRDMIGEGNAVYYNVAHRWFFGHGNMTHSSLCSTAIRTNLLPVLLRECSDSNPFVDSRIWTRPLNKEVIDNGPNKLVVGIKGMPGRAGYGCGHTHYDPNMQPDPELNMLRKLIGDDVKYYEQFYHEEALLKSKSIS